MKEAEYNVLEYKFSMHTLRQNGKLKKWKRVRIDENKYAHVEQRKKLKEFDKPMLNAEEVMGEKEYVRWV